MKIAIIGTGISGLGAAWLLHAHHDITVYEANSSVGGHSRTIDITISGKMVPVDTGFIVFNYRNYPNLVALFERIDAPVVKSDMSFGASIAGGSIEYGSKGMFSQFRNILRPSFWGMIFDILRFNRRALAYLERDTSVTLRHALDEMGMGDWFRRYYLQAMGAAIWSCSVETILDFPASTFIRFFENHGLLTVDAHPQWYTVQGGSREYVKRLTAPFRDRICASCAVTAVTRTKDGVVVEDANGNKNLYDHVIIASHANQALEMLTNPTEDEMDILGSFRYQSNSVVVHSDASFMPKTRGSWASWVYLSEEDKDKNSSVSLSYWMNNLQPLGTDTPVIVTLNPGRTPDASLVHDRHEFHHPVFDSAAVGAQKKLTLIQGTDRISYCGAYQRYGFHEDGLASAVAVVRALKVPIPWD